MQNARQGLPEWATWSLAQSKGPELGPEATTLPRRRDAATNKAPSEQFATLTSLLRHRDDEEIYDSTWQEYDGDQPIDVDGDGEEDGHVLFGMGFNPKLGSIAIGIEDVESILRQEPEDERGIAEEYSRRYLEPGFLDFSPLSPSESRALTRCLRLSRYVVEPPLPQGRALVAHDGAHKHLNGIQEFGKLPRSQRPGPSTDDDGLQYMRTLGVAKSENKAAKASFKNLCRIILPRRHFDWILAQLMYSRADMLGLSSAMSLNGIQQLILRKAKDAVKNHNLQHRDAALVMHALADASNLDLAEIELLDPKEALNGVKGKERRRAKQRQRAEAAAVTRVLKMLFPTIFGVTDMDELALADEAKDEAMRRLEVVKKARSEAVEAAVNQPSRTQERATDCECSERGHKTYKTAGVQTGSDQQVKRKKYTFPAYESLLYYRPTTKEGKKRRADGVAEMEATVQEKDGQREKSKEPDDMSEDSDWGDLEYDGQPVAATAASIVVKKIESSEEHRASYERTMIAYNGKPPSWLLSKFRREARQIDKIEKIKKRSEEAALKEADKERKKKEATELYWAKARAKAEMELVKKKERELVEARKREREDKRFIAERRKLFRVDEKGRVLGPAGRPSKVDTKIRQELKAQVQARVERKRKARVERNEARKRRREEAIETRMILTRVSSDEESSSSENEGRTSRGTTSRAASVADVNGEAARMSPSSNSATKSGVTETTPEKGIENTRSNASQAASPT